MKTIKFFSFAMLLAFAWVSCKDANTTSAETTSAEAVADSIYNSNKYIAAMNMASLSEAVVIKIAELETAVSTASDATKEELTTQLETCKKFKADLEAVIAKVANATPETWAAVQAEVDAVHHSVKSTLTSSDFRNIGTDQQSN